MQNKKTIHEKDSIYKKINIKYLTTSNLLVNKNTVLFHTTLYFMPFGNIQVSFYYYFTEDSNLFCSVN